MMFIKYFERAKLQNQISFFENKLFVTLLLVVVLGCAFSLSACSSNEDASAIDPEEEYTEEEYTEEDTEADAGMEELLASYFPYDKEYWYLVRGNNTYTLNASIYDDDSSSTPLFAELTYCDTRVVQTDAESPIPVVLQKGDTVISTFPREAPVLKLFKANFYGWGFSVIYYDKSHELDVRSGESLIAYDVRIEDEDGNIYKDPYSLEKDKTYKISWDDPREGYNFCEGYAVNRNYKLENPNECYEVEGVKTESGRAEYDLSDIPPGIYRIGEGQSGGFIEIK